MKWLPLKMNFLPLIFHEINLVTEEYISLLSKLRQKEKEKEEKKIKINNENDFKLINQNQEESENDKEDDNFKQDEFDLIVKKYNGIRESIGKRINELEIFYEDNIEDIRVSNIEKARLRLKKLLMYSFDTITKIENSSQQKNIFIKDSSSMFSKKITEDTKKKIMENNISLEKQLMKEIDKEEEKAIEKLIGPKGKRKKSTSKKERTSSNKKVIKIRGDEGFLRPLEIDNFEGGDFDEFSKLREIVFKIKLNQDEYKTFLKEKKNKGQISPYLFK